MDSKVHVEANQQGNLISVSPSNSNWGWIRVVQTRNLINEETGVLKSTTVSALIQGTIKDLKQLNWVHGQELDGIITFKDSFTPFRKNNPEKDFKIAGSSGIVCSVEGQPIYRKYMYHTNPKTVDIYIQHDDNCKALIKQVYTNNREFLINVEENVSFAL